MSKIVYEVTVDDDGVRWRLDGKLHREDGPAGEYPGAKHWYLNDKLHREDGPAIIHSDGSKFWYKNGGQHREDGPAVEWKDGAKLWFLNGTKCTEDYFNKEIAKKKNSCDGKIVEIDGKKYKLSEYNE